MSASAELQRAIYGLLTTNAGVRALVGERVYDGVPDKAQHPYVNFGASDFVPDEADCQDERIEAVTMHVWSRDQGRTHPCKAVVSAVYDALHEVPFAMTAPYALAEIRVTQARVFLDADNITAHGIIQVEARVERV